MRLQLGLELVSGAPAFTNFTPEFTETLDYVFIEGGARGDNGRKRDTKDTELENEAVLTVDDGGGGEVVRWAAVAPMPEEGPLRAMTPGLPSETFPSDHVSVVVDLALTT